MPKLDDFLNALIELDGSDLHMCCGLPPKVRIHGNLEELDEPPVTPEMMAELLREICPPEKWERYIETHDLDFAYEIRDKARFRVNYMYNHYGMGTVMRLIPTRIKTIDDLKLPQVLKKVCRYDRGLVLVTGPTGSGKSTTLAAMIDYVNVNWHRHIVTIEEKILALQESKRELFNQLMAGVPGKLGELTPEDVEFLIAEDANALAPLVEAPAAPTHASVAGPAPGIGPVAPELDPSRSLAPPPAPSVP